MINKIYKPLPRLIKKKREKSQITNIRNNEGGIAIDNIAFKKKMRAYYEQLHLYKFVNLYKKDQFLKIHKLSEHTKLK